MGQYVQNTSTTLLSQLNDEVNACRAKATRSEGASLKVDNKGPTQTLFPEVAQISQSWLHVTKNLRQKQYKLINSKS